MSIQLAVRYSAIDMGGLYSKNRKKFQQSTREDTVIRDRANGDIVLTPSGYDESEIKRLTNQLDKEPEIFILNHLLMLVNFYENFENEKKSWNKPIEGGVNKNMVQKRSERLVPDVIFEHINDNVGFQRKHGKNKGKCEPLVPKRIVVVTDIIEVLGGENVYTSIDKPSCQVRFHHSEHVGFVKLTTEDKKLKPTEETTTKTIEEPEPPTKTLEDSQPGPSSQEDEVYEYKTITKLNTPKPLQIAEYGERRDTLPETCYTVRKDKNLIETNSDDEDEEEEDDDEEEHYEDEPKSSKELYSLVTYMNSVEFMKHFESNMFPHSVGEALGFTKDQIKEAQPIPGKIFCHLSDPNKNFSSIPCVIIPAIPMQWPVIYEFQNRPDRPTVIYQNQHFKWLPLDMIIHKIEKTDCVLVPKGFYPKKGSNPDSHIEWEICFPKAERVLDTSLSRTKIRAFLFILILYKTYIAPVTEHYGLLIEHIRTFMYWQYEGNPKEWPEHALGQVILKLLTEFNNRLAQNCLPDFFYKKKNVFENIPNGRLQKAQEVFHNVLQSPVIYFLGALRNLKVLNQKFYPMPNIDKLYEILTKKEEVIQFVRGPNFQKKKRKPRQSVSGHKEYLKEVNWEKRKEEETRRKVMERRRREQELLKRQENLENQRKNSVESINLDGNIRKLTTLRTIDLLKYFIRQYIEISKYSRKLSTQKQTLFYLKQASYLANVLQNHSRIDSQELLREIEQEEERAQSNRVVVDQPPSTPQRNSILINTDKNKAVKRSSSVFKYAPEENGVARKSVVSFQ